MRNLSQREASLNGDLSHHLPWVEDAVGCSDFSKGTSTWPVIHHGMPLSGGQVAQDPRSVWGCGRRGCMCVLARGGVSAQGRFPSSALGVRSVCTLLVLGANRQGGSTPLDPWGSGWSQCFLWEGWMISPISGMSLLGVVCQVTEGISSS